jgi:hypothetical protein
MKLTLATLTFVTGLLAASIAYAQAPAAAPAGSTGMCKDGSYTSNATKKGSCAGHKGVKDWYAAVATPAAATTAAAPMAAPATAPATATAAATAAAPAAAPAKPAPMAAKPATPAATTTAAPGGGAGQVWVNTASKVYHCNGTKYYGKTKQGEYMTEAAAKAAGDHADHGKACS